MRKPSLLVKLLIIIAGGFLTLPLLFMGHYSEAFFSFLFFFVCWSLLQCIGRDRAGMDTREKWYFRFILLVGACGMFVAPYLFITSLLHGEYQGAVRSLAAFIMIAGNAWRYRKSLVVWFKNNPV